MEYTQYPGSSFISVFYLHDLASCNNQHNAYAPVHMFLLLYITVIHILIRFKPQSNMDKQVKHVTINCKPSIDFYQP